MKKCSNRFVVIATILIAICIIPQIGDGGSAIIKETDFWKASDKADYPKVIVKGSPDNEPVKYWKPEPFEGTGELVERWREDLQHSHNSSYLNNIPEGWLFTACHDNDDSIPVGHINRLIDPYDGEVELLDQRLSMHNPISTDDFVYTDFIEYYDSYYECGPLVCYDIKNKKQRWYIENPSLFSDRTGIATNAIRMMPTIHDNKIIYFKHDSLVGIDSRTGEVLWSYDRKDQFPWTMELFPYTTDEYYWILYIKGWKEDYVYRPGDEPGDDKYETTLFRYNIKDKTFNECLLGYGYSALLQDASDVITVAVSDSGTYDISDDIEVALKWHDSNTLEEKSQLLLVESFLELYPEYSDVKVFPYINLNISKYTLLTYCIDCIPFDNVYFWRSYHWFYNRFSSYDCKKYHFLLDRNNPDKLIEISPALTNSKNTFAQVVDNELIIQTRETITCYNPDKLTVKWTIDKSNYEKPEEAFVYAVDYRGVLVCEELKSREDYSLSRFHCYEMSDIQPIPEPEPVPEPEPIPEPTPEPTPEPEPEPLPVDEKIILKFKIDVKEYSLDDVKSPIDVAPIILNGRTLLPARFVTEPLGGDVSWDVDEKKVVCILGDVTIEMWIDKPISLVNGKEVQIDPHNPDVTPTIIDDRTMVPIRFLAENLGCETKWDAETREIILTYRD